MRLTPDHRLAILLHGGTRGDGKTGLAMLRYGQVPVVAVIDADCAGESLAEVTGINQEIPIVDSIQAALAFQPTVLAIGLAPSGGSLPPAYYQEVKTAIAAGLSIVNGLHTPLGSDPELVPLVKPPQWIWDVRQEPPGLTVGAGRAASLNCRRVLAVGTDMAVGKMSTGIELHRLAQAKGLRSQVIATGQTNLMLGDDGIPLDAIRVDFAAGAVEQVVMRQGPTHDILFIEGQGSLLNPASTATLPLMRGSQPTHLVLVHRWGQTHIDRCPQIAIPPLAQVVKLYETVATAAGAFQAAPVVGIALNTRSLPSDQAAQQAIHTVQTETGLPCADVVRFGGATLLEAIFSS